MLLVKARRVAAFSWADLMAMRLHEVHPALVHVPLTLVPTALVIDAVGHLTHNAALKQVGRYLTPVAAGSAAITGAAGYIAQGAVRADGQAHDMLVTHRNLNTTLVALTGAMAAVRIARSHVGVGYFLLGLAGVLTMGYTAYLGGKMVYSHRVGVEPTGVDLDASPEIRAGSIREVTRQSVRQAAQQVQAASTELAAGEVAPHLRRFARTSRNAPSPPPSL